MLKVVGASWEQTRFTFLLLGIVAFAAIIAVFFYEVPAVKNDGFYAATAYWMQNRFRVVYWGQNNDPKEIKMGAARAYYTEDSTNTGWATLEIQTTPTYPDWVQAYAAGLLEGSLCWRLIYWHWQNTIANTCKNREDFCKTMRAHLLDNAKKTRSEADEKESSDAYWHQVKLFYTQLDGIEEGWKNGVSRSRKGKIISISHEDFIWMNSASDLRDMEFAYNVTKSYDPIGPANSIAFLKYLPHSMPNFLLAHEAAGYYSEMLRVQKKYSFNFHYTSQYDSSIVPGNTTVFTSYPGSLYSQDDFYQIYGKSELTIAGSSIRNYNYSLWQKVDFERPLLGPRVVAANRLSKNGKRWVKLMSRGHSGTGNKQWLVVQTHQKVPKLYVLEQTPGTILAKDMTHFWHTCTYWISNGVPFFEEIRNITGYIEGGNGIYMVNRMDKVTDVLTQGQKDVNDERSLFKLMRSPEITAIGRSDIIMLNITTEGHLIVDDKGFSVHYEPYHNTSQNPGIKINHEKSTENNHYKFHDIFPAMINDKGGDDRFKIRKDSSDGNFHRIPIINEDEDKFKEYDGLIDLKVSLGHEKFKAAAGPPYTDKSEAVQIEPFEWSKSSRNDIPHYGQRNKWEYGLVLVKWVW